MIFHPLLSDIILVILELEMATMEWLCRHISVGSTDGPSAKKSFEVNLAFHLKFPAYAVFFFFFTLRRFEL